MSNVRVRRPLRRSLAAFAVLLCAVGATRPASAQVACGSIITGHAVMTQDLVCGANAPAVTIDGGSLDMAGHKISGCPANGTGITLINSGGKLSNGWVAGCTRGVALGGSGGHTVSNVMAYGNSGDGFYILSVGNKLLRNTSAANLGDGFRAASAIQPSANRFTGNAAFVNAGDGFDVDSDDGKLRDNIAVSNGSVGFRVAGLAFTLQRNASLENTGHGFFLGGAQARISQNIAVENDQSGLTLFGGEAKLKGNMALGNVTDGIYLSGDHNVSQNQVASVNGGHGFVSVGNDALVKTCSAFFNSGNGFTTATGDTGLTMKSCNLIANDQAGIDLDIVESAVLGSVGYANNVDADDASSTCATNLWKGNSFANAADACIE